MQKIRKFSQQCISHLNKILQVKNSKRSFANIWALTVCRSHLLFSWNILQKNQSRTESFAQNSHTPVSLLLSSSGAQPPAKTRKWICRTFIFINDLWNIVSLSKSQHKEATQLIKKEECQYIKKKSKLRFESEFYFEMIAKIYSMRAPCFTVLLPSFSCSIACFLTPHDNSDTKL